MKSNVKVKICGLTTSDTVQAAIAADTFYIGFVFFANSPRYVKPQESTKLAEFVPETVIKVGLVVDADVPGLLCTIPLFASAKSLDKFLPQSASYAQIYASPAPHFVGSFFIGL